MKNYVQPGHRLTTVNTSGAAKVAGQALVVGAIPHARIRIAMNDVAIGGTVEAAATDVFSYPARSADTWADGAIVYYSPASDKLTSAKTGIVAGAAIGAKVNLQVVANIALIEHPLDTPPAVTGSHSATV